MKVIYGMYEDDVEKKCYLVRAKNGNIVVLAETKTNPGDSYYSIRERLLRKALGRIRKSIKSTNKTIDTEHLISIFLDP
jgi:hypothetical protein